MADIFDTAPSPWRFTATPAPILYNTPLPLPPPPGRTFARIEKGSSGDIGCPSTKNASVSQSLARVSRPIPSSARQAGDPMSPLSRIAVSGASGLVGSALCARLSRDGCGVTRLVRTAAIAPGEVRWDPGSGRLDASALEGVRAVVHLAGENIAGHRWNPPFKERVRRSRVEGTSLLAKTLARLETPPAVFLCASAIGIYGDRRDEILTEESGPGEGFLSEVCRQWEEAAEPARMAGIRTIHLRLGTVLSSRGGALAKMLPPFKMGLGGRIGSGRQWMSWISLEDAVGAITHLLADGPSGPVNGVSPHAVTNREFAAVLASALHRPALFPLPAAFVRIAFGEMGDALLLASCRVSPSRLETSNFQFTDPHLEGALRRELANSAHL